MKIEIILFEAQLTRFFAIVKKFFTVNARMQKNVTPTKRIFTAARVGTKAAAKHQDTDTTG